MITCLFHYYNLFFMSKTRSYAKILIGSRLFLTVMAIYLSLRVAPLDLQQGGNSRIPYVHVPASRMSILVYIATAINTFLLLLTKHPLFLRSSGTSIEIGAFFTLFTLVWSVFNYNGSTIRRLSFFFRIYYSRRPPTQPLIGRGTVHKLGI